ncbi:MAG: archaeoflavoprotein AfpA [Thermoleophilia bacterium]
MTLKVVWGITGSGDLMPETFAAMTALKEKGDVQTTAVLSKAAVKVVRWYKLWEQLEAIAKDVLIEEDANTPFIVGRLQTGRFDCLLVAPLTANSAAKIAHGVADTIITNAVAQTNKIDVPIFLMPVDQRAGTTLTTLPGGEKLELAIRSVDIENAQKLAAMDGIVVLSGPQDIEGAVAGCSPRRPE